MRSVEITGETVEEAVEEALQRLGVGRADAEIEILAAPARGIFRFFAQRHARVRVTVKLDRAEWSRQFVERVAQSLLPDAHVTVTEDDEAIHINVQGSDLGLLIGRHGQTLNALQDLVNAGAARFDGPGKPVVVDVEGYRQRRSELVEREARRAAQRVRREGRSVALSPMTAAERKLVHVILKDDRDIRTESIGREPFRRVLVLPAGDGSQSPGRGRAGGRRRHQGGRPGGRGRRPRRSQEGQGPQKDA
ncbi:MAG TPA: RNA-binding cell elongation regulator Jag/EloR [Sphingobacteriaceae bacterium]|nr:RNA-binding cell elongation regulator Jag/EloR [Sphingobacteriaceae bacterium]